MISRLSFLLFCGIILAHLGDAQKLPKVKKLNMKAYINITGDTLVMKFHRPNENIKLEGFILGYGSNYFTNQYIQWPDNGKSYITDVDAETRYLIAVKPNDNYKKSCKDKNSVQKPLQLVVGTLTPTSVFLSWGILINPQVDWSALNKCPNDRFYTVRYREKNKDWHFQLCPTTETVIDNLKPNTIYEFGVKDNSEDETWSKPQTHKTSPKGKENGNMENSYKIPKGTLQYASEDTKAFVPVTKVKQGFQNLSKSTPPPNGKSQAYRDEIKKPYVATTTTRIATPKPKPVSKSTESPPVSKPSEKPDVDDPKPVASQPIVESFTPDLSTGTLEWVRATMVTHPFFQVTNIPIESSATDEHTASLVVRESDGTQDESAGIATLEPVLTVDPPRDILVSPTIAPFPFPKELPSMQPETVLADERPANYVPNEMTVSQIVSGREQPVSTDAPQSSVHTSPEQQKTTLATQDVAMKMSPGHPSSTYAYDMDPVATDIPQARPLLPLKKHLTTLAADENQPIYVPTNMPILEKIQTRYATTRQSNPARQTSLPLHTRTKSTTAFTSGQHIHTAYESSARTEVPPPVSAMATENLPAKQRTWPPHTQRNSIMALTKGPHIHTTFESIARTEAPPSVSAQTTQIIAAKQSNPPSHTQPNTTMAFTESQHIQTGFKSITSTEVPPSVSATASQVFSSRQSTLPTHVHTKTTTAFTGGPHIHTTYESIARTEAPPSVSAHTVKIIAAKQSNLPSHTQQKTTMAFTESQHIQTGFKSITSTEVPPSVSATASPVFSARQSTLPTHILTKTTTAFTGSRHTSATQVPNETASFHTKPFPSTEAPNGEADSTQPDSEIKTAEAPHTYEPETFTLASHDKTVQKFSSTSKPKTTTVRKTTARPLITNAPTTSQWTQSTQESKKTTVSHVQHKTPLPEKTHPTPVLKDINPTQFIEETTTTLVPTETQKRIIKKTQTSESPSLPVEPNKTEQDSSPKFNRTTESPTTSTVVKPVHSKRMPINLIPLQIFADPTAPSETQTSSPPIPKTTQSNKKFHSKPAPKSTQRIPINFISLQIFEEPDVPLVSNTQRPDQSTTTQKPESPPHSEPVPTQKVSTPITKKPKPTPRTRAKPASTGAPMDTTKPKRPHVIVATTLAPYRLQHSSSRPKTSLRPRTRLPALNGATQAPIRSRPTGEFNWLPGTIPGGKGYDSTKLLGVSRNISMEPNNTAKRTFSVSSPPLPPVRPTSIRRRIQHSNVTGRPRVSVSSPPLLPVRPTSIRRKPPATNVTGRPGNQGGILIPRAPSTATPECTFACIKSPMKQPTLPSQEEDLVYSTVFSPSPKSDIDALGKPRYTAPHVVYMSKNESVPCSITDTLKHFPTEEESTNQEITSAPQNPPANLTVVTVEGCSSFVVLNWEKPDNDTVTEYNVISKENGGVPGKDQSIITTNLTHSTVENLKPDTSYEFQVIPKNPLGEGPSSATVEFITESADPRVSEPVAAGKDAIWTEIKFKADPYSDCKGRQYVKRTWYKKFVGIQLCNSLRYKIYLSDTLTGTFYNIGDQSGFGEDHCQFVDSFLEGRTGEQLQPNELNPKKGFYRSVRQQPVEFGDIGGQTHISYVHWYECGISIPGKW